MIIIISMNTDCIFGSLCYYKLNGVIKCLLVCKQFICFDNEYFWKLRKEINYKDQKIIKNKYYDDYQLYYYLNKIKKGLYTKLSLYYLYMENIIMTESDELKSLPTEIGKLINLRELYLDDNSIQLLPTEFGQLLNLQYFSLIYNKLNSLPTEIGQLLNLQYLYLSCNHLKIIPIEICNLINLQYLSLDHNKLEKIPTQIGQLINLIDINLCDNKLQSIPTQIAQLINLKYIHINFTQIKLITVKIENADINLYKSYI